MPPDSGTGAIFTYTCLLEFFNPRACELCDLDSEMVQEMWEILRRFHKTSRVSYRKPKETTHLFAM